MHGEESGHERTSLCPSVPDESANGMTPPSRPPAHTRRHTECALPLSATNQMLACALLLQV